MKHPLTGYTVRALFKSRGRSLWGILGAALCIACITCSSLLATSYFVSHEKDTLAKYGRQNGILYRVTDPVSQALSADSRILQKGLARTVGTAPLPQKLYDHKVVLGAMDTAARELSGVTLLQGRLPQQAGELALEESLCAKLYIPAKAGQTVTLDVTPLDSPVDPVKRTFTVSGILSNYTELQGGDPTEGGDSHKLPGALLSEEDANVLAASGIPASHALLLFRKGAAPQALMKEYADKINGGSPAYFLNTSVFPPAGRTPAVSFGEDPAGTMLVLSLVCIGAMSLFCIVAVGLLQRKGRQAQIIALKLAGASNRNARHSLELQFLLCYLLSMPLGIGGGCLLGWLAVSQLLHPMASYLNFSFGPWWLLPVVALGAFFALGIELGVFLVHALNRRPLSPRRGAGAVPAPAGPRVSHTHPIFSWGLKSMLYRSSSYAGTVLSMAVCVAVFLVGAAVSTIAVTESQTGIASDFSVVKEGYPYATLLQIPTAPFSGFADEDAQALSGCPELNHMWGLREFPVKLHIKDTPANRRLIDQMPNDSLNQWYAGRPEFQGDLERVGYGSSDLLFNQYITGLDDTFLSRLQKYATQGRIDRTELRTGQSVVLVTTLDSAPYRVGDSVDFTQLTLTTEASGSTAEKKEFKATISAIVQINSAGAKLQEMLGERSLGFLWHEDAFAALSLPVPYSKLYLELRDSNNQKLTETLLAQLNDRYPNATIRSQKQEAELYRAAQMTIQGSSACVVLLIACFGLLHFAGTVRGKVLQQLHTWGALRAAGLRRGQAVLYQVTETAAVLFAAWALGLLLAMLLSLFLIELATVPWAALFPWALAAGALPVLLLAGALLSLGPILGVYRKNLISLVLWQE